MRFAWGFLLGAFAGAAVAMIVAPQTGDEVRDVLYARSRETSGRVRDAADDLAEAAKTFSSEVQASVAEMIERGKVIIDVARSALDQAVDEGRRAANEQRETLESQSR
jgi:gas vesicle protein